MIQYADHVVDALVAPEFSKLITFSAPELPELPNYFGSFFLNNFLRTDQPHRSRSAIIVFLRRLAGAFREYRLGREALVNFVNLPRGADHAITLYLRSLSHFEYAVSNLYLSLLAHNAVAQILAKGPYKPFRSEGGSSADRLRQLFNTLKHYDERIEGNNSDPSAPIWLTNDGIRGRQRDKTIISLEFPEFVSLLTELREDARFLSEDVYRIAAERRAAANKQDQ